MKTSCIKARYPFASHKAYVHPSWDAAEGSASAGNAEVHAAMAALLYAEKPMERQRAELQWDIATEFDSRYGSIEWVAKSKVWGPRLLQALQKFLLLQ